MVSWSSIKRSLHLIIPLRKFLQKPRNKIVSKPQQRKMAGGGHDEHYHFEVDVSRFQWRKFKDLLHFYVFLGVLPITAIVMYANIFIGPAQLTELPPSGRQPEYWEYHKHPISRFIARYMLHPPQQDYEKYLHMIYEESEKLLLRKLENKVRALMSQNKDYQAWTYRPVFGKYLRVSKETADELEELRGNH